MNIRRSSSMHHNTPVSSPQVTGRAILSKVGTTTNMSISHLPLSHDVHNPHSNSHPDAMQSFSVEQKLSYKVAELTQVVHLLFVKCQEKELQCSVLQQQIETLQQMAQSRATEWQQLSDEWNHQKASLFQERNRILNFNKILEGKLKSAEERQHELVEQVVAKEHELHDIQSRYFAAEVHRNDEITALKNELRSCHEKMEQQADHFKELVQQTSAYKMEMEEKLSHHVKSKQRLQNLLDIDRGALQEARNKTQQLEAEVKNYQREMKRLREEGEIKAMLKQAQPQSATFSPQPENAAAVEVQQLKEEIIRYKLELFNREQNFNRIFVDKRHPQQTLRVNSLAAPLSSSSETVVMKDETRPTNHPPLPPRTAPSQSGYRHGGGPVRISSSSTNRLSAVGPFTNFQKEKTFSYVTGQSFDDEKAISNPVSTNQRISIASTAVSKLPIVNRLLQKNSDSALTVKQRLF